MDRQHLVASMVAIREGTIVAVDDEPGRWRGNHTEIIDLASGFVTSGLVDGSVHEKYGDVFDTRYT
ncbi:hypothetical protein ACQP1O_18050 [Nocardia sp. CA-151230]|uniref:hypothetical protein n=1 Tax=Nocardia sp. CA-151230 TaxID=3239982 RepID=UPI003D8C1406